MLIFYVFTVELPVYDAKKCVRVYPNDLSLIKSETITANASVTKPLSADTFQHPPAELKRRLSVKS
jgi:hypothetical protein